jgi:hypothetical protein
VTGPCTGRLRGARDPIEASTAKVLGRLEIQDRGFTLAEVCCPFALLGEQRYRAQYCRAPFQRAVICWGDERFGVKGHSTTPALKAGRKPARAPNAHSSDNPAWLITG